MKKSERNGVMPGGSGKGPSGEKSPSPREGPRAVRAEGGGAVPLCRELRRREESGGSERGAVLRVRERRSVLLREKGRAARGQRGDGAGMAARALERQQPGASCGRALHRLRAQHSHSPLGWFGCHFHHLRTLKCHVGLCWGHLGVVLGSLGGFLEANCVHFKANRGRFSSF